MNNNARRAQMIGQLVTQAAAEINASLPALIYDAVIGLQSLSEGDESAKIRQLEDEEENLVDQLRGLGMIGDRPDDREDTNAVARNALLDKIAGKIRSDISVMGENAAQKLNVRWRQASVLDEFSKRLDQAGGAYYALLCTIGTGK